MFPRQTVSGRNHSNQFSTNQTKFQSHFARVDLQLHEVPQKPSDRASGSSSERVSDRALGRLSARVSERASVRASVLASVGPSEEWEKRLGTEWDTEKQNNTSSCPEKMFHNPNLMKISTFGRPAWCFRNTGGALRLSSPARPTWEPQFE
mmetsp:Transcript_25220/g.66095  ORF Transcript_25220/g.66095 Transcript_25220/m.66095 type:complete len:150 (+) Transcript_25220:417-866(+)